MTGPAPLTVTTGAIALGANLGERQRTLSSARASIATQLVHLGAARLRWSGLFETDAVGPPQPAYLNAAVVFDAPAGLDAPALMAWLLALETRHGRMRAGKWGPRTLDLDLLWLRDARMVTDKLTLPHPHVHQRPFVLVPLEDADPDASIPGQGSVTGLLAQVGRSGVRKAFAAGDW